MSEPASDWIRPEAERFVQEGSFRKLRRQVGNDVEAYDYFSLRQVQRFPLRGTADVCCDCGGAAGRAAVRAEWEYRFPSARATAAEAIAAVAQNYADYHQHGTFWTFHPVCASCMRRWWAWRIAGLVALVPAIGGVALGLGMGVFGLIFYYGGIFSPSDRRGLGQTIPLLFAAAAAGFGLWRLGTWLRIPAPLRKVAGPPIELKRMKRRPAAEWRRDTLEGGDEAAE